jgi:hypothetical protein
MKALGRTTGGRHRNVDLRLWSDAKFRSLSRNSQFLWLFLLTCPYTGDFPGLFRMSRAGVAEELDLTLEEFDRSFAELQSAGMAEADWAARLVWLPNAVRYNPPDNTNVAKAWAREFMQLPECDLRSRAAAETLAFLSRWNQDAANAFAAEADLAVPKKTRTSAKSTTHLNGSGNGCFEHLAEDPFGDDDEFLEKSKKHVESTTYPNSSGNGSGEAEPGEPGEPLAEEIEPGERKAVPYAEVIEAYHAACPSMPRVTLLNPGRKAAIRSRWSEARKASLFPTGPSERDAGLAFFADFFTRAEASDLLAGRKSDWRASFDWLMGPKNFGKVLDGCYDNRLAPAGKTRTVAVVPAGRPEDYRVAPSGHVVMRGRQVAPALPTTGPGTAEKPEQRDADSRESPLPAAKTGLGAFF